MRQADDLLAVGGFGARWDHLGVAKDVVGEFRAYGPRISQVVDLDRRAAVRENPGPTIGGEAVEIDGDVGFRRPDHGSDPRFVEPRHVMEMIESTGDPAAHVVVHPRGQGIAGDLEPRPVMAFEQPGDQVGHRVLAEVR